jgi:hypothetical protein
MPPEVLLDVHLDAFVEIVNAKASSDKITPEQQEELIAGADSVKAAIGCSR